LGAGRRCSPDVAALEHVLVVGDGRDEVVVLQVLPHVPGLVLSEQELVSGAMVVQGKSAELYISIRIKNSFITRRSQ
jgi:hypothetical protein